MIDEFRENARVEKQDGAVIGPYPAMFAGNTILILDEKADVEEGDTILRELPNGRDERSLVTKATFFRKSVGDLGAHYQIKYTKGGSSPKQESSQQITISGAQSVQIGDHNTQHIVNTFDTLVKTIDSAGASQAEKNEAKSHLKRFLEHPLVVSVLGTSATTILQMLHR